MAQLLGTDKFIVDRGGSTYKATFGDIEESLNLEHDFTGKVIDTPGGQIDATDITIKGEGFLQGQIYTAFGAFGEIVFQAVSVDETGGILSISIDSSDAVANFDPSNPISCTADPITSSGSLFSVVLDENPSLDPDTYATYGIRQLNPDGTLKISGGAVKVTNDGGTFTSEILIRGANFEDGEAFLEFTDAGGNPLDGSKITIGVADPGDFSNTDGLAEATIGVTGVSDGLDTDKAELVVTLGDNEKTVYLVPGEGIALSNTGVDNEIMITNTISALEGGGDSVTDGTSVIVNEVPPNVDAYTIRDGTLWYNLLDGRLYIAVTYSSPSGDVTFDWIDASPSSLNDALRKNQNDSTNYKIDVNNSLYATHFALERLPLIS